MNADEIITEAHKQAAITGECFDPTKWRDEFEWANYLLSQYDLDDDDQEWDLGDDD